MPEAKHGNRLVLPEWQVSTWINAATAITLQSLRGRAVLIHAFQMLCPACVAHGLPQAQKVRQAFAEPELAVVGLHTVFEHHDVMTVNALRAFVHEYRWSFPIGVDQPDGRGGPSITMSRYGLRGTPSCLVLDRYGRVRLHHFGQIDDLVLGTLLGQVLASEGGTDNADASCREVSAPSAAEPAIAACDATGCRIPSSRAIAAAGCLPDSRRRPPRA